METYPGVLPEEEAPAFFGVRGLVFVGEEKVLAYTRDDSPGILYANKLDLPGGGPEAEETPEQTFIRETYEEFGLTVPEESILSRDPYWGHRTGNLYYFFVAVLPAELGGEIRFGEEGAGYELIAPEEYLLRIDSIPEFRDLIRQCLPKRSIDFLIRTAI
jgi:8-oxo-dGTP diphosphatase